MSRVARVVVRLLSRAEDWRAYPAEGLEPEQANLIRRHERTGRPLGSAAFLQRLETRLGCVLPKPLPGRKPRTKQKYVW